MKPYRKLFNNSFQRVIVPNPNRFYKHFYQKLVSADARIKELFATTDMNRQIEILTQSMTYMMSFSATLESNDEIEKVAELHGNDNLNILPEYYDIWLECMLQTVKEFDSKYDDHIETSWRVMMAPGLEYMKSFCNG